MLNAIKAAQRYAVKECDARMMSDERMLVIKKYYCIPRPVLRMQ
jgi:hypothetical protein